MVKSIFDVKNAKEKKFNIRVIRPISNLNNMNKKNATTINQMIKKTNKKNPI
jgi:hypothetical protein